jgi:hypothetical protein
MKKIKTTTRKIFERADYDGIGGEANVTITVKLPVELREFWQAEARKRRQFLSVIIMKALAKELGLPPEPAESSNLESVKSSKNENVENEESEKVV